MKRIFLVLVALDSFALLVAAILGALSKMQDGVLHPESRLYLLHFLTGLVASLTTLFLHCLIITYFLGTGRWVKEVCIAYNFPDDNWPRKTRDIKRGNTPFVILAMLITIAAAATGQADQQREWPWWIHLALAIATLVVNLWVFQLEARNLRTNVQILEEVQAEVDRVRAERGLPTNEEALRQENM
jgi:hypothetical protein